MPLVPQSPPMRASGQTDAVCCPQASVEKPGTRACQGLTWINLYYLCRKRDSFSPARVSSISRTARTIGVTIPPELLKRRSSRRMSFALNNQSGLLIFPSSRSLVGYWHETDVPT